MAFLFAAVLILSIAGMFVACGQKEEEKEQEPSAATVTISKEVLELERYGTSVLEAEADAEGKIIWSSTDESVVTVSSDGTVMAMGLGSAKVVATLEGTQAKAECAVTVIASTQTPVILFDKNEAALPEGGTLQVTAKLNYRGTEITEAKFTFDVDDKEIATVSADGTVTGVKVGTAKLIATTQWRGETFERSLDIKVQPDASVVIKNEDGETLTQVTLRSSLPEGTDASYIDRIALVAKATEKGQDGTGSIAWSVSEGDAVTVDAQGLVVAAKTGKATVRAEYTTTGGDKVFAETAFTVVLPDVATDKKVFCERTDKSGVLDLSAVASGVTAVEYDDMSIAQITDGQAVLRSDWVASKADGEYDITVSTDSVIYRVTLVITTKYMETDLNGAGVFNIVDTDGGDDLWTVPGEDDKEIVGDRTNVMRYENKSKTDNPFGWRAELNNFTSAYKGYTDYVVFDVYLPEDYSSIGFFFGTNYVDISAGSQLNSSIGYMIGADGIKTDTLRTGEWMTIILDGNKANGGNAITRFMFLATGGNPVVYYVSDLRMYPKDNFDLVSFGGQSAGVSASVDDGTYTVKAGDFNVYIGLNKAENFDSIVLSGGDASVATAEGAVITFVGAGQTTFDVLLTVGSVKIETTFTVSIVSMNIKDEDGEALTEVTLRSSLPEGTDPSYIDRIQLVASVSENVTWSVSEGDAVTVDANGLVVAKKTGTAVVRATYTGQGGEEIWAEVSVTVVLPDVDAGMTVPFERTEAEQPVDLSSLVTGVTDIQCDGVSIADVEENSAVIRPEWLAVKADGEYTVSVLTESVIYNVTLKITSLYHKIDLDIAGVFNIVDTDGGDDLWTVPGAEDAGIVGERTNVMRYENKAKTENPFGWRVELNSVTSMYAGHTDYVVFDLYMPEGQTVFGAYSYLGSNQTRWIDVTVGGTLRSDLGFFIGANGVKTDTLRSGEWMTVVLNFKGASLSRFAFLASGGNACVYYISDLCLYSAANWDTLYCVSETELNVGLNDGSYTVTAGDAGLYRGEQKADTAGTIVLTGGDDSVATAEGAVITLKGAGETSFDVQITAEGKTFNTKVRVIVTSLVIEIDRSVTGTLSDAGIEGTVTKVICDGEEVANSADISSWLKTIPGCSLATVVKNVEIQTAEGANYTVTLNISDTRDYIDRDNVSIFKPVNSKSIENFWVKEESYQGKEDVYLYKNIEGCTIWDTRVDFRNDALYGRYDYVAVELYVENGSEAAFFVGGPGGAVHSLKEGSTIEGSVVFAYMFDAEGNQLTEFKTGEWVTVFLKTSILMVNRCAFAQTDNTVTEYRVGEMMLYNEENVQKDFQLSA